MSFREERDVFAFTSESELKSSPSERLVDLEAISATPTLATQGTVESLFENTSVFGSADIEMMLKA